ncbi:glycosyltransferase family 4 protein [Fundicoccus sp. Sow4_D5]|uniref:glycosyltransferase family 4 protein n=1 Tax=Fundicoccus sp. Sow4_D5 TaxID=3438782 RepID=UPI003F918F97
MTQESVNKKIIVFHPMQQHSYKTAIAVKEAGFLYEYWTSVYYSPEKTIYKLLSIFLGGSSTKRMKKRTNETLNAYVRTSATVLGLLFILSGKITKSKKLSNKMQNILSIYMGKKLAKSAIKNEVDYIIAYDTWAHGLINELEKQHSSIKVIMDYSSLYAEEIVHIIEQDIIRSETNMDSFREFIDKYKPKYMEKYRIELEKSSYFLSPSKVVNQSLTNYGVLDEQIQLCPYGSNFKKINFRQKPINKKIVFVYIGRLSYAKGVHHLINAFKGLKRDDWHLQLIGEDVDGFMKQNNSSSIEFIGFIHHEEVTLYLSKAHIAISASLFDGFSLSLLESASYNLPIICTYNTGVSDYIVNGVNGYKVETHNENSLRDVILKVLNSKETIDEMSIGVGEIVETLTWKEYNKKIKTAINNILVLEEKKQYDFVEKK